MMSSEESKMLLTKQDFHFRSCIYLEEKVLHLSGLHPEKLPPLFSWGTLKPLTSLAMVLYLTISTSMTVFYYDFDVVVESIMLGFGVLRFLCKIAVFLYHRQSFRGMMDDFEDPVFYSITQDDLEHFRAQVKKTRILGFLHFSSVMIYTTFLAVSPFIFDKAFQLVLIWEPLDLGVVTYLCHLYGLCFAVFNHVSMDNVFMMMSTFASCQFDIIINSLRRMDFRRTEESEVVLRGNIVRHLYILRFINRMNQLVSYMALIQYLMSIMAICVTLFQIMKNPQGGSNFAFLLCMMVEIILYCWYGEAIKDKNDDLSKTLYLTNWEESHVKIRRMILIIRERCKKPIRLEVGGFTTMTLNSFVNIMKSAYSSFTVLRQVYN